MIKQPVVLESRCYTTDPDKKWELCDVPEDPSWPQVPFCGLKDEAGACGLFGANAAYQREVGEEGEGDYFVNGPATCPGEIVRLGY